MNFYDFLKYFIILGLIFVSIINYRFFILLFLLIKIKLLMLISRKDDIKSVKKIISLSNKYMEVSNENKNIV